MVLLLIFCTTFTFSSFAEDDATDEEVVFINPVDFPRVTARFGMRKDPFTKLERFHRGIDLAKAKGSPVKASCGGTVLKVNIHSNGTGYGKYIIIVHAQGYATVYAQLSKVYVEEGEFLKAGDMIGLIGSSGRSTGPHLHFEIRKANEPVDPEALICFND
jgi:murein DD-endopeptidase MepM/ murein hydrolase activator NlpD